MPDDDDVEVPEDEDELDGVLELLPDSLFDDDVTGVSAASALADAVRDRDAARDREAAPRDRDRVGVGVAFGVPVPDAETPIVRVLDRVRVAVPFGDFVRARDGELAADGVGTSSPLPLDASPVNSGRADVLASAVPELDAVEVVCLEPEREGVTDGGAALLEGVGRGRRSPIAPAPKAAAWDVIVVLNASNGREAAVALETAHSDSVASVAEVTCSEPKPNDVASRYSAHSGAGSTHES